MELTYGELVKVIEGLRALSEKQLRPVSSLRVARWMSRVRSELGVYDITRSNLIKELGKYDKKTDTWSIDQKDSAVVSDFMKKNDEMLAEKTKVDLEPLTEEDLVAIEPKWVELLLPIMQ